MTKKRLGVGMIGAGFITNFHIRSWIGVRDSDIQGIYDPVETRANDSAVLTKKLGVGDPKVYKSITDMVAAPDVDALWICAPNYTRIEGMEEIVHTIESGKGELIGIACEKPLGRNVPEASKMLELAQKLDAELPVLSE